MFCCSPHVVVAYIGWIRGGEGERGKIRGYFT